MADLATQHIVDAGTVPTFAAASASDTVEVGNGGNVFVVYKNGHATLTRTIVLVAPGETEYGAALPDPSIVVPAVGQVWVPIRRAYSQGGRATITAATPADLTVAVVKVG